MKTKIVLASITIIIILFSLSGCNTQPKTNVQENNKTADDIIAQYDVNDNLELVSITKIDDDDVLYTYKDTSYRCQIYICKNLKSNTVSITTNKYSN